MINRYGTDCTVTKPNGDFIIKTKAFIHPLLYHNRVYVGGTYLPDGYYDGGHYLYIGKADVRLDELPMNSTVICKEDKFIIKRAERYLVGEKAAYVWAVLRFAERSESNG